MTKKWYVVHAYSGFEKNVARALEERVELAGQKGQFGQILVRKDFFRKTFSYTTNFSSVNFSHENLLKLQLSCGFWKLIQIHLVYALLELPQ